MASTFKNMLASSLVLLFGLATAPALAQTNGGFDDLSGDADSNEVFGGSGVSLTDIMGNLRRADGISAGEYSQRSDRNIDEAAEDFRQRQQEALEAQQGTAASETPVVEEQL
ncbi:MAG: hypothetical protein AAF579_01810 [Cyanobacteria bacterium P01_C01_bin.118]